MSSQLISMDREYETRNGQHVRVLCIDRPDEGYPVVALIGNNLETFTSMGKYDGCIGESGLDLVEIVPLKEGDIALFWDHDTRNKVTGVYDSEVHGSHRDKYGNTWDNAVLVGLEENREDLRDEND